MFYHVIMDSQYFQSLSFERKGVMMEVYLYNLASSGSPYIPATDEARGLLSDIMKSSENLIRAQMDMDSLETGYIAIWAEQYLEDMRNAGVISGDVGVKTSGLVARSKLKSSDVGYQKIGVDFDGILPTSRYESTGQVYIVTHDIKKVLSELIGDESVERILEDYFVTLLINPKIRPSAGNMPSSIIKFARMRGVSARGKDRLMEALCDG